jgi:hypothetical protein
MLQVRAGMREAGWHRATAKEMALHRPNTQSHVAETPQVSLIDIQSLYTV